MTPREKVVLAYSGGLDTSVAIPWLRETKGLDVVAVTVDVGQAGRPRAGSPQGSGVRRGRRRTSPMRDARVRRGVHPPRAPGERPLRRGLSSEHRARPAADRPPHGRGGASRGCLLHRARLHREGETTRSGSISRRRASPPSCGVCSRPRMEDDARGRDRLRARAGHRGGRDEGVAVQHGREPLGPIGRVRDPRGPLRRAPGRGLRLDPLTGSGAPETPTYVTVEFDQGRPVAING